MLDLDDTRPVCNAAGAVVGRVTLQKMVDVPPAVLDTAVAAMAACVPWVPALQATHLPWALTMRWCDAEEGRSMNRDFRGKDYATNVLSFESSPQDAEPGDTERYAGDLLLCWPVVVQEARDQRKTLEHHVMHLAIHGLLHLHGYDHEGEAEAEAMERLETEILATLNVPDPYEESMT